MIDSQIDSPFLGLDVERIVQKAYVKKLAGIGRRTQELLQEHDSLSGGIDVRNTLAILMCGSHSGMGGKGPSAGTDVDTIIVGDVRYRDTHLGIIQGYKGIIQSVMGPDTPTDVVYVPVTKNPGEAYSPLDIHNLGWWDQIRKGVLLGITSTPHSAQMFVDVIGSVTPQKDLDIAFYDWLGEGQRGRPELSRHYDPPKHESGGMLTLMRVFAMGKHLANVSGNPIERPDSYWGSIYGVLKKMSDLAIIDQVQSNAILRTVSNTALFRHLTNHDRIANLGLPVQEFEALERKLHLYDLADTLPGEIKQDHQVMVKVYDSVKAKFLKQLGYPPDIETTFSHLSGAEQISSFIHTSDDHKAAVAAWITSSPAVLLEIARSDHLRNWTVALGVAISRQATPETLDLAQKANRMHLAGEPYLERKLIANRAYLGLG